MRKARKRLAIASRPDSDSKGNDTRFVLNRCAARTIIARDTAEALAEHQPPALSACVGQRVAFADAARTGRLVAELDEASLAAREVTALAREVRKLAP